MSRKITYQNAFVAGFGCILITATMAYSQFTWVYTYSEIRNYLQQNDPAIDANKVSDMMLELARQQDDRLIGELQVVISRDSELDILKVFTPTDPPDYNSAAKSLVDLQVKGLTQLLDYLIGFSPFSKGVLQAFSTFKPIIEYAGWLNYNLDLIAVNKQIHFYLEYKKGYTDDPFAEYGIASGGYLFPPPGFAHISYIPLHTEIYTPQRIKNLAEAYYVYLQQHGPDFQKYRGQILNGVNDLLHPMIQAYDQYATGTLTKVLRVGDGNPLVVVGNKGDILMQNVVLVNDLVIGDERTSPIDIQPGSNQSIQPNFSDIDYLEFDIFGTHIRLNFNAIQTSILSLFTFTTDNNPTYAPATVHFRINPIPVGDPYSYQIDFGDWQNQSGSHQGILNIDHLYTRPGKFKVTVTVTAGDNSNDSAWRTVTIINPINAAYPLLTGNDQGYAPLSLTFDASGSTSATGGSLSYNWDFGDGTSAQGVTPSHQFQPGEYQVRVIASLTPEISDTSFQTVKTWNPVVAFFTFEIGQVQNDSIVVTFDASPPDTIRTRSRTGSITSYNWNFGDGYSGQGETVTHKYRTNAYYAVSLTATDNLGYSATYQTSFNLYLTGPTHINGLTVANYVEWNMQQSPYVIHGDVTISSTGTLRIRPGTVVKFQSSRDAYDVGNNQKKMIVKGSLICDGEPNNKIFFTSDRDDNAGGDTNGDGGATTPRSDDWGWIQFDSGSINCLLDNVVIRYGGIHRQFTGIIYAETIRAMVFCNGGSPVITDSEISDGINGIYVYSGSVPLVSGCTIKQNGLGLSADAISSPTITNNIFLNNGSALQLSGGKILSIIGNSGSGNGTNGIIINGAITQNCQLTRNAGLPYLLGGLSVNPGVVLTLNPGVVVKMSGNLFVSGTLNAIGTAADSIIFTSYLDDRYEGDTNNDGTSSTPAPGNWESIVFLSGSSGTLDHVVVQYGGYLFFNVQYYSNIYIANGSPTIRNSRISRSQNHGIRILGTASPTIQANTISDNGQAGINDEGPSVTAIINGNTILRNYSGINSSSSVPTITNNVLQGNTTYAVLINSANLAFIASGNTGTGNAYGNGMTVSGTVQSNQRWVAQPGFPFFGGGVTVASGATLTLDPGVVVKMGGNWFIDGTLQAVGTASDSIIFTSIKDDRYAGDSNNDGNATAPAPGDWEALVFRSGSSGTLDHVVVQYGGHLFFNEQYYSNIYIANGSPIIRNSRISHSQNYGIRIVSGGSPLIQFTSIHNNAFGLLNATTNIINARNNWWGHATGPLDNSDDRVTGGWYNPNGLGNAVSNYVDYDLWLSAPAGGSIIPDIAVNPAFHNYGDVGVGSNASKTFSVSNQGTTALQVTATTLVGGNPDQFSIASGGGPFTLAGGQSQNLVVSFNPTSAGTKSASLQMASNDPNENPFSVALTGNGVTVPQISLNDVTVTEGNSGTVNAVFTATLSFASSQQVTVDYATADGTASAGSDYVAIPTTQLIFPPNTTTQTITVVVNGDLLDEVDETFFVNLSNATNATIADNQGQGTITDDDLPPSISINDVTVTEGNAGTVNAVFTVTLAAASSKQVTVDYVTADGTATAGSDYVAIATTTLTFPPNTTTQTITVVVNGDVISEPNETFFVNLSNPTNATIADAQGLGTIADDDGVPSLSINDVTVTEGNTGTVNAIFTVTLSAASSQQVTVNYATANGTATAGSDYVAIPTTQLAFPANTTTQTITVIVNGDVTNEPNETFFVNLSNPNNATIADAQGMGTISNDDVSLVTIVLNPTDDAYVRSDNASSNYGTATTLRMKQSSPIYNSYLKFVVSGVNGAIQSAKLRMAVTSASSSGGSIYTVSNTQKGNSTPWTQSNLNYNNAPTISGTPLSTVGSVTVGQVVEFNVTSAITGNNTFSFGLNNASTTTVQYSSKEGNTKPELVIQFVPQPPAINSFSPLSGPVGTQVTITGNNFTGTTQVLFNSVAASVFTVNSNTQITATVPTGAATGKITVTTPGGTAISGNDFTVTIPPPTISSFTPTSGPVGTQVTITGSGFSGATQVAFNGVAASSFTVDSNTQIRANVPTGATTGKITITTPNGTGTSSTNFTVSAVNFALNKPATASSTNGSNTPNRAVDGNTSSYWRSGSLNSTTIAWLKIDLQTAQTIGRTVIRWSSSYYARNYQIQVSDDNTNWATVYTDNAGNGGIDDFTFASASTRYVRLYMTRNNSSSERVIELELYAPTNGALAKALNEENENIGSLPEDLELQQNYPNPFNPITSIPYSLPEGMKVTLKAYNITGQEVAALVNGYQDRGNYTVTFDASNLPSGIYFMVLKAGAETRIRRIVLMK